MKKSSVLFTYFNTRLAAIQFSIFGAIMNMEIFEYLQLQGVIVHKKEQEDPSTPL